MLGIFNIKLKHFSKNHACWFTEKTKYYAIRVGFQERVNPHVHSFVWIFNAPNIRNETAYIEFIEKTMPPHFKGPGLFELVKTYQAHARSRTPYHVPNKYLFPEKFADHVLLLFYPFRDEKTMYQNKLQEL